MGRRARVTPEDCVWVTTEEASCATGFSVGTLRKWARDGQVSEQYLEDLPGGYLWHRSWVARPQVLRVRPAAARKRE